jgi:hypothetical protein
MYRTQLDLEKGPGTLKWTPKKQDRVLFFIYLIFFCEIPFIGARVFEIKSFILCISLLLRINSAVKYVFSACKVSFDVLFWGWLTCVCTVCQGALVLDIKDASLINMSDSKDIVKESKEVTDTRLQKPDWRSVCVLNFNEEVLLFLRKYTYEYAHGYQMLYDAVTCLEHMRFFIAKYRPGNIDTDTNVSWEDSFRLQQLLKYELPGRHEACMETVMGPIIHNNFYSEKGRMKRQEILSEMPQCICVTYRESSKNSGHK